MIVRFDGSTFDDDYKISTDREFMANQAEIIRSPLVLRSALSQVYGPGEDELLDERIVTAVGKLKVIPVIRTDILKISYRSRVPGEASRVVSSVIDTYRSHVGDTYRQNYTDAVRVAALQEEKLRTELNSLREQYGRQRSSTPIVGQGKNTYSPHLPMAMDVGEQLANIRTRRLALESSLSSFSGEIPTDMSSATRSSPALRISKVSTGGSSQRSSRSWQTPELKARELARSLGSEHPSRRAAEEQLSWMRQRFVEKSQQIAAALREDLRLLGQSEARLRGEYRRELDSARAVDGQILNDEIVLAEIDRVTEAYSAASQQARETAACRSRDLQWAFAVPRRVSRRSSSAGDSGLAAAAIGAGAVRGTRSTDGLSRSCLSRPPQPAQALRSAG